VLKKKGLNIQLLRKPEDVVSIFKIELFGRNTPLRQTPCPKARKFLLKNIIKRYCIIGNSILQILLKNILGQSRIVVPLRIQNS
jgi:hypothetical protein